MKRLLTLTLAFSIVGCAQQASMPTERLSPPILPSSDHQDSRVDGPIGATNLLPASSQSYGAPATVSLPATADSSGGGTVSLVFSDTDIREVVAQILGSILQVSYTIDPAVHGTATLHTAGPLARSQLLPTLQALLAQNGATLVQSGGLYRVIPTPAGVASSTIAGSPNTSGSQLYQLRYTSAVDLARVLQPFVGQNAKIIADPGSNSLVISGDPDTRATLAALAQAFDIDLLAGQSYALLPTPEGAAQDFATSLQSALRSQGGGLSNIVRVVPMERISSVLVVASQPQFIQQAQRVYQLLVRQQRLTVRSWHVYYLQDSKAEDAAYILQQAFTPGNITASPSSSDQSNASAGSESHGNGTTPMADTGSGGSSLNGLGSSAGIGTGSSLASGGSQSSGASPQGASQSTTPAQTPSNPLLGGLSPTGGSGGGGDDAGTDAIRIIPDPQNNSVITYTTQEEEDVVEAMLRKIDILPLQVRIDATIAEVTLNNQLQYGTQFFFQSGGVNGILNNAAATTSYAVPRAVALATTFPGFILSGNGAGGAPIALQALQAVTTVHVLSSPELMVLDNQTAHLQVGDLVPYLTSSSQSTITTNAPVINSVSYQPTGVIMNVTPRVNSGGLVTLDISQEVSAIDSSVSTTTTGISSPTFSERNVTSRVVIQDGQTVGLAGLITDSATKSNSGIPFLKDIPILGLLAGTQSNQRTRTELLVLITPHVLYNQRDARALTSDLEDLLKNAAAVPTELNGQRSSGSDDPNERVRRALQFGQ
ncbi:type II secretion system secretin GspD [Acidisoma cellulosilytica]|uniref:Type II secretion system secretin GspD n=1 Tax=Acidisoma cellulosilyticum TaxID=2802395 RepID=A0A963Z7B4_9PROT|nr:type II secretion system secretin GspD [Acidisoma cellulosilyticum]MCB8883163.1 type II secretion system secretin GspD [Acidisoma cellulosilyticum]